MENLLLVLFASYIMNAISLWRLFTLAGKQSWQAFIPIYNRWVQLQIMQRPKWWLILLFIPIVGTIIHFIIHIDFIRCFGKRKWIDGILVLVTLGLYVTYINYDKKTQFVGVEQRKETLISALLFAIIFATIVHTFFIQPFTIPTGSLEHTLLRGDFLFVNKLAFGSRVPTRPVALPFLQNKITFSTQNPENYPNSYVDAIKLPYYRFPGYSKIKNNDLVVFNFPTDSLHQAIDRKDPYVKRCVGLPGDKIEIVNEKLFINGKAENLPKDADTQHSYFITFHSTPNLSQSKIEDILGYTTDFGLVKIDNSLDNYIYRFDGLTKTDVQKLSKVSNFVSLQANIEPKGTQPNYVKTLTPNVLANTMNYIFPKNKAAEWTVDNYGPLTIPKKGDVITLTNDNIIEYYKIIKDYEHNSLEIKDNQFIINGKPTTKYTIQQDYYFMMGDNRDNSYDSRYFGFVPEDHIMGKPVFTWLSVQGWFDNGSTRLRTERMFRVPNTGIPLEEKNNWTWLAILILAIFFGWDFIVSKFKKKSD